MCCLKETLSGDLARVSTVVSATGDLIHRRDGFPGPRLARRHQVRVDAECESGVAVTEV